MAIFVHTADWHLGAPQAHPYFSDALEKLIKMVRKHNVSIIVCVGDVFDRPNPDQKIKDYLLEQILKNEDLKFVFSIGNHDYTSKLLDYHSLHYLDLLHRNIRNVHVLNPGETVTIENLAFWSIPSWESLEQPLPLFTQQSLVGLFHGIVPGVDFRTLTNHPEGISRVKKILTAHKLEYLALGDIHKCWKLHDRCFYPGALYSKTFSDEDGIIFVRVEDNEVKVRRCAVTGLPQKVVIDVTYEDGKHTEDTVVAFIKKSVSTNSIVKLVFNLPSSIYSALQTKRIKTELLHAEYLDVVFENKAPIALRTRQALDTVSKAQNIFEELEFVIDTWSEAELPVDRSTLKTKIKDFILDTPTMREDTTA